MRFLRAYSQLLVVALGAAILAGCTAEASRYIQFPDFSHPGPAAVQRAGAIQHDPYLLNDVGPDVVGARPLAYQQPVLEEKRAVMTPPARATLQAMPAPGVSVAAPPVMSSPYAVAPPQPGAILPSSPPPIVTGPAPPATYSTVPAPMSTPYPAAPAPLASPYPPAPAPVIAPSYPAVAPPSGTFPSQQRAPY